MAGRKIFEVEGKFHLGASKAVAHFVNAMDAENVNLLMRGSFFSGSATITNEGNGEVVARIRPEGFNAWQLLGITLSYSVTVAQGVDLALIVAMVVCLDMRKHRKQGTSAF